jgi:hypothetical protein
MSEIVAHRRHRKWSFDVGKYPPSLDAAVSESNQPGEVVPLGSPPDAAPHSTQARDLQPPGQMSERAQGAAGQISKLLHVLESAQIDPPSGNQKARAVVGNALICVIDLVQEFKPDNPTCVQPLRNLLYALKNLDQGHTSELLKKYKPRGRAPKSVEDVLVRSLICAAMTCLVKGGMKREEASRAVYRTLHAKRFKFPDLIRKAKSSGSFRAGAQIEKWRERIMEEERSNNLTGRSYRDALELVREIPPDRAAKLLIELTQSCHPSYFPSKE